jgi:hypothetical protein
VGDSSGLSRELGGNNSATVVLLLLVVAPELTYTCLRVERESVCVYEVL